MNRERQRTRLQNANIKQIVSGKDIINISMISRKLALIAETIFGKKEKTNWPHIEPRKKTTCKMQETGHKAKKRLWLNCSIDREEKMHTFWTNVHEMGQFKNHLISHAISFASFRLFLTQNILVGRELYNVAAGNMKFVPHRINDSDCNMDLFWKHTLCCTCAVWCWGDNWKILPNCTHVCTLWWTDELAVYP